MLLSDVLAVATLSLSRGPRSWCSVMAERWQRWQAEQGGWHRRLGQGSCRSLGLRGEPETNPLSTQVRAASTEHLLGNHEVRRSRKHHSSHLFREERETWATHPVISPTHSLVIHQPKEAERWRLRPGSRQLPAVSCSEDLGFDVPLSKGKVGFEQDLPNPQTHCCPMIATENRKGKITQENSQQSSRSKFLIRRLSPLGVTTWAQPLHSLHWDICQVCLSPRSCEDGSTVAAALASPDPGSRADGQGIATRLFRATETPRPERAGRRSRIMNRSEAASPVFLSPRGTETGCQSEMINETSTAQSSRQVPANPCKRCSGHRVSL